MQCAAVNLQMLFRQSKQLRTEYQYIQFLIVCSVEITVNENVVSGQRHTATQ